MEMPRVRHGLVRTARYAAEGVMLFALLELALIVIVAVAIAIVLGIAVFG